ncbi:hypothetical protein ACOZ38_00850 [Sphaerisporangium viridialbum]|uniref:hypothetical protein n=1 Tax=Sphaerisporangium viridialbum TaxID=46189 RepID=UPI003C70F508
MTAEAGISPQSTPDVPGPPRSDQRAAETPLLEPARAETRGPAESTGLSTHQAGPERSAGSASPRRSSEEPSPPAAKPPAAKPAADERASGGARADGRAGDADEAIDQEARKSEAKPEQPSTPEYKKAVYNMFLGSVDAARSVFGFGDALAGGEPAPTTGRLGGAVVSGAVDRYAPPVRPYDEALESLRSDRIVVVTGETGIGKRTGAIVLLRTVLGDGEGVIVSLPPSATLKELAERGYESGYGYAVFDRTSERRAGTRRGRETPGWDTDQGWPDADHTWLAVSEKVREAGAYLVVTTPNTPSRPPDSVRHVAWVRPPVAEVLRAHLGDETPEETVAAVVAAMPEEFVMADLVLMAERIIDGRSAEEAVNEVLDQAGRRQVREWFDRGPSRRQVLEVTALAFVAGVVERGFETCMDMLSESLEMTWPEPEPAPPAPQEAASATVSTAVPPKGVADAGAAMPQERAERHRPDGLIRFVRVSDGATSRRVLAFKEDAYRRYVLEELSERFRSALWDAVQDWLSKLIKHEEFQLNIAAGLALLSYTTYEEIEFSYLEPWSRGECDWEGQCTAVYVLWFMCLDEALVPVALRTAEWWAGQGTAAQRLTAITAFAGELGVRFPTPAARRLWQLVVQDNALSEEAAAAFGSLFATLVANDADASHVVQHLRTQLKNVSAIGRTRRHYRLTLIAILGTLRTRSARTGNLAIIEFVREHPERLSAVAELWAAVLRHRPCRRAALKALLDALNTLGRLSGVNAEHDARMLGDALGAALPEHEYGPLKADFITLMEHSRKRPARSAALTKVLLAALDRAARAL